MPNFIKDGLVTNPSLANLLTAAVFRNGMYRASSVFIVSLSFAEFEAMIAPFAIVLAVHGRTAQGQGPAASFSFSRP